MPGLAMTQTTSRAWYKFVFDLQFECGFEFDARCWSSCATWFAVRVRVRRNRLWAALRLGPVSEQAAFVSAFSLQRSARCPSTQHVAYRKSSREFEINEWDKQQLTTERGRKRIKNREFNLLNYKPLSMRLSKSVNNWNWNWIDNEIALSVCVYVKCLCVCVCEWSLRKMFNKMQGSTAWPSLSAAAACN